MAEWPVGAWPVGAWPVGDWQVGDWPVGGWPTRERVSVAAGERGSMTLVAVGLMSALVVFSLVATGFAGLVAMQHRAAAAADLAALAAAEAPGRGCAVATEVAADNGASLSSCEVTGAVVTLEVRLRAEAPFGFRPTIRSRARAGPAGLGETASMPMS
ncbi:MAG TPA: Rv3654c family TadE-like protein [Nocardioidaceae bacterium]|nr:Rv3654c family TadE-like protein [Nocardioidaceae bacterium]